MIGGNDETDGEAAVVTSEASSLTRGWGEDAQDANKPANMLERSHLAGVVARDRSLRTGSEQCNTFKFRAKDWPIQPQT